MKLTPGTYIKATNELDETFFEGALIFIAEYNDDGALGFMVNKRSTRTLNQLVEFRHSKEIPLYLGGPADQEHLYFIHKAPEFISGGTAVNEDVYFGGDFSAAVKHINNNNIDLSKIKIFLGYCGWNAGELEAEIAEGSWSVAIERHAFD